MAEPDFSRRAELEELMDGPCSYEELRACLQDIAKVNRLTFARRPTMEWLAQVVKTRPVGAAALRILDVGCGYGDMLRQIERWAARDGIAVELTGVDLNPQAVRAAREATAPGSAIVWVVGDVYSCAAAADADIVISSLLAHHLREDEIVRFLRWMEGTARVGWFINDLHRQAVPYFMFRAVAAFAGWHRFVRNDGPISIRRSFVRGDWLRMGAAAGLEAGQVEIREYRPARLCVGRVKRTSEG
jgi:SAM-dependent methyltransferase